MDSVDEREQWICVAGATPACWAWTVQHELAQITVREGEPDPDEIPQFEVVRTERADWTRSVTLDLDAGTARLQVAKGAVGHPVDGPEQCRLDPSAAPPTPLPPVPADEMALAKVLPDGAPFERTKQSLSEIEPNGTVFRSSAGELGAAWYESSASKVAVLLHSELGDEEHFLRYASTFVREDGEWKLVVTEPIYRGTDLDADYATTASRRPGCGPEDQAHRDLRITTRESTKRPSKRRLYRYRDGAYVRSQ